MDQRASSFVLPVLVLGIVILVALLTVLWWPELSATLVRDNGASTPAEALVPTSADPISASAPTSSVPTVADTATPLPTATAISLPPTALPTPSATPRTVTVPSSQPPEGGGLDGPCVGGTTRPIAGHQWMFSPADGYLVPYGTAQLRTLQVTHCDGPDDATITYTLLDPAGRPIESGRGETFSYTFPRESVGGIYTVRVEGDFGSFPRDFTLYGEPQVYFRHADGRHYDPDRDVVLRNSPMQLEYVGFEPNASVNATLYLPERGIHDSWTVTVDATGRYRETINMPAGAPAGLYSLEICATDCLPYSIQFQVPFHFSSVRFCSKEGWDPNQEICTDSSTWLPRGTTFIGVSWAYDGVTEGDTVLRTWKHDGTEIRRRSSTWHTTPWELNPNWAGTYLNNGDEPFPDGIYTVEVYWNGTPETSGSVRIGQ